MLLIKKKASLLLQDLNRLRGAVGRTDVVWIGGSAICGSDGVWATKVEDQGYADSEIVCLSYLKLLEIVRSCDPNATVTLDPKKSKGIVKCAGAAWVLNLRTDEMPDFPFVEGAIGSGSIPSLLDCFLSLQHLIKLDLSRPGLMFAQIKDELIAIGDGTRLGVVTCYANEIEIALVVLQEVARLLRMAGEEQNVTWVEDESYCSFSVGNLTFAARKMEGGFEREWREEVEESLHEPMAVFSVPAQHMLSAVQQVLVVSEDLELRTEYVEGAVGGSLYINGAGEGGEKALSKVVIVDGVGSLSKIRVAGESLKAAIQARKDPSVEIQVSERFIKISDTLGFEVMPRQILT